MISRLIFSDISVDDDDQNANVGLIADREDYKGSVLEVEHEELVRAGSVCKQQVIDLESARSLNNFI